jgi:alkyl hydroperoxide reductase subunit AhpF
MKRILWIAVIVVGVGCAGSDAQAGGWAVCSGCHNGAMAPNKGELLAKYTNTEAFIKAAQASDSPMMARIKEDIDGLKAAATELGLEAETTGK